MSYQLPIKMVIFHCYAKLPDHHWLYTWLYMVYLLSWCLIIKWPQDMTGYHRIIHSLRDFLCWFGQGHGVSRRSKPTALHGWNRPNLVNSGRVAHQIMHLEKKFPQPPTGGYYDLSTVMIGLFGLYWVCHIRWFMVVANYQTSLWGLPLSVSAWPFPRLSPTSYIGLITTWKRSQFWSHEPEKSETYNSTKYPHRIK
jgi:hypothetical protein